MIGLGFYNSTPTSLDLNGPFLRFTSEPESQTVNDGGSVTLSGIATAEFKHNPTTIPGEFVTNTGSISYQWYIEGIAAEDISGKISGSQTNELTLSNLSNPADTGKSFVLRAEYNPSAYQSEEGAITAGIARSTGYAPNAPVDTTSSAIITVNPTVTINSQPQDATAAQGLDAVFTIDVSVSDGSDVTYQWNVDGSPVSDSSTVSGSNTPTLTLSDTEVGDKTVNVTVTHPTAGNSPVTSDNATYTVVSARTIVAWDIFTNSGTSVISSGSKNLFDGSQTLTADPNNVTRGISLYAPEKDTKVRFTMKGAAGGGRNGNRGGEGGEAVFEFVLTKGVEHYIALGAATQPTGGTNGGGGAAYMYRKGRLIVAIGGGGGAGNSGRGGDGGGIGVAGENGQGRSGGAGGQSFAVGTLPTTGFFPGGQTYGGTNWSSPTAGRISGCPMGSEYFRARFGPCDDVGDNVQYRRGDGTVITGTASLNRGFKPGIGHRNNGGNGSGGNGGGASGAYGGNSGSNDSGGGGGSGYSSGDVTVISTRRGGNTSQNAFITMEYVAQ